MKRLIFSLVMMLAAMTLLADELQPTAKPIITVAEHDEYIEVMATGEGEVHLQSDGVEIDNPSIIRRVEQEQSVTFSAWARAAGYARSEMVFMSYVIPSMPPTPEPVIVAEELEGWVIITATGEGEISMCINGEPVSNPFQIERDICAHEIVVTATAKQDGHPVSEVVTWTYVVAGFPLLPEPVITYEVTDSDVYIYVTGEGDITLFINDEPVAGNMFAIPRTDEEQVVIVYARATAQYYVPAESERYDIVIPALPAPIEQTDAPTIGYTIIDEYAPAAEVIITPTEESVIYYRVKYNEEEFSDWLEYDWPIDFTAIGTYRIEAYAIAEGKLPSYPVVVEFTLSESEPPVPHYDFEVDGIYYDQITDNKVGVVENGAEPYGEVQYVGDIVIPNQVEYDGRTYNVVMIDDNAFAGCEGVTSVSIGNYVTRIGYGAFYGCTGLTEVTLGDYVITIDGDAFAQCTGLNKVTIGHGVRSIGENAFSGCPSLITVICKPAVPPVMANRGCFDCYETANLIVYPAVLDSYQNTDYWNQFSTIKGEDSVSPDAGDVNGDGIIGINDVTRLIDWILAR